jgi:hypothetical protein
MVQHSRLGLVAALAAMEVLANHTLASRQERQLLQLEARVARLERAELASPATTAGEAADAADRRRYGLATSLGAMQARNQEMLTLIAKMKRTLG